MSSLIKTIREALAGYDAVLDSASLKRDIDDASQDFIDKVRDALEDIDEVKEEVNLNNPIAQLQERSQANGTPLPLYTCSQTGESHMPVFTCECSAEGYKAGAKGKDKQTAKRRAARGVLELIFGIRRD